MTIRRSAGSAAARSSPGRSPPSASGRRTAAARVIARRLRSSGKISSAASISRSASRRVCIKAAAARLSRTERPIRTGWPSSTSATPCRRTESGDCPSNATPPQEMSPLSAGKIPAMVRTRVDLPAPLAPRSAVISPGGMLIETSRSTGRPPRATKRLRTVSSCSAIGLLASQIGAAHDRVVEHRAGWPHGKALAEIRAPASRRRPRR